MEYRELVKKDTVIRKTTTLVPVCEFCGDDAEYLEEYNCDIAWCDDCVEDAHNHIVEEYVGYQYVSDVDPNTDVEYLDEEE